MAKSQPKRKTRSDKFPLTLHPTGQFCKKIRGKLYYFGNDKKKALQRYLEEAANLQGGHGRDDRKAAARGISIKTLCNLYLDHQQARVEVGDLTERYYADQIKFLRHFVNHLGTSRLVSEIRTSDLQRYRNKLLKAYKTAAGVNLNLAIMKAMFHWVKKNDILENIPNIDAVSKAKIVHSEEAVFTSEQIRKLMDIADTQISTMIWLGLNCGFGCADCAELRWDNVDLENGRVKLARKKTGIFRNLPLWPETIQALKSIPRRGELVFYTRRGNPWVRVTKTRDKKGVVKYSRIDAISAAFSKLLKKANIKREKGAGFYTLRRTSATLAARSGDPFAVQKLLGHADLKMATTYVQDISEQTDRVINNSRKLIIQGGS